MKLMFCFPPHFLLDLLYACLFTYYISTFWLVFVVVSGIIQLTITDWIVTIAWCQVVKQSMNPHVTG